MPRVRVSLNRRLVLALHSEHLHFPSDPLFSGTYEFVSTGKSINSSIAKKTFDSIKNMSSSAKTITIMGVKQTQVNVSLKSDRILDRWDEFDLSRILASILSQSTAHIDFELNEVNAFAWNLLTLICLPALLSCVAH